jgi:hypothetical protein
LIDALKDFMGFLNGNRWSLGGMHVLLALLVPLVIVTVGERLIRRR